MMKLLKIMLTATVIVLTTVACGDEFLNLDPVDQVTEAGFFKSEADADAALASAYDMLQKYGGFENEYLTKLEWLPVGDMQMEESPADRAIEALEWDADNERFSRVWRQHYTGIARANTVIQRIEGIEASDEAKDLIRGQAQFLRALFYFSLARTYGGVPLILEEPTADTDFNVERASLEDVWAQVESDLTAAASVLPVEWDDANLGRAKRSSALALLAKTHLYQEEWEQAIQFSEQLMDLNVHSLEENYRDAFRKENEHNEEDVFSVQYRDTNQGGWGEGRDGHFLGSRSAPRGIGAEFAPFGGWSNWVPTQQWVDAFERNDEGEIIDSRYEGMVMGPGEPHPEVEFTMPDTINSGFSSTGYILTKWWFGPNPNNSIYSGQNIPVIRYAEVLLNYAEALNEVGRSNDAIDAINTVRARADLAPLSYDMTQDEILDMIFHERRIEMFWEQSFFSDLNRRGRFMDFIRENRPDYDDLPTDAAYLQQSPIRFPIPLDEIDNNPNMTQNDGY
jgi:hypothetical protein